MSTKKNATPETNANEATTNNFELVSLPLDSFTVCETGTKPLIRETTTTEETTLFNAVNGGGIPIKNILGEAIEVTAIVITSAEIPEDANDKSSKIVSKPCVNFFTREGEHYATLSNGVVRATRNLLSCGLTPTEETPVKLKFRTIETAKGIAHTFDLVR